MAGYSIWKKVWGLNSMHRYAMGLPTEGLKIFKADEIPFKKIQKAPQTKNSNLNL